MTHLIPQPAALLVPSRQLLLPSHLFSRTFQPQPSCHHLADSHCRVSRLISSRPLASSNTPQPADLQVGQMVQLVPVVPSQHSFCTSHTGRLRVRVAVGADHEVPGLFDKDVARVTPSDPCCFLRGRGRWYRCYTRVFRFLAACRSTYYVRCAVLSVGFSFFLFFSFFLGFLPTW